MEQHFSHKRVRSKGINSMFRHYNPKWDQNGIEMEAQSATFHYLLPITHECIKKTYLTFSCEHSSRPIPSIEIDNEIASDFQRLTKQIFIVSALKFRFIHRYKQKNIFMLQSDEYYLIFFKEYGLDTHNLKRELWPYVKLWFEFHSAELEVFESMEGKTLDLMYFYSEYLRTRPFPSRSHYYRQIIDDILLDHFEFEQSDLIS